MSLADLGMTETARTSAAGGLVRRLADPESTTALWDSTDCTARDLWGRLVEIRFGLTTQRRHRRHL